MALRKLVIQDLKKVACSDDAAINPNVMRQPRAYTNRKTKGVATQGRVTLKSNIIFGLGHPNKEGSEQSADSTPPSPRRIVVLVESPVTPDFCLL
ncbi:hypothetical protein CDL15_Pgr026392 [Punica granatum]|uniref:Uncharacterized protein n=1 Tax=Punica granatum TaxID=22663 RepID=A0A218XNW5_PUNGR|nr:hypothetical protein CDL15_Pgr026392 [Punica granatum]